MAIKKGNHNEILLFILVKNTVLTLSLVSKTEFPTGDMPFAHCGAIMKKIKKDVAVMLRFGIILCFFLFCAAPTKETEKRENPNPMVRKQNATPPPCPFPLPRIDEITTTERPRLLGLGG